MEEMFQANNLSYRPERLIWRPSPLALLNPNACPRFSFQTASRGQTSRDTSDYIHKRAIRDPILQREPKEQQDRRRQAFLEKVRQVSDDKKWESRSQLILRKDFLSKQKEWEFDQARSTPEAPQDLDDDERETEPRSPGYESDVEMIDRILEEEKQGFEALVSRMQDDADPELHRQTTVSDYGSDEEVYDQLFMDFISSQISAGGSSTGTVGNDDPKQGMEISVE